MASTVTADLQSLLHRIAQRDSDALLRFYDRTSDRVFGVIGNLVADADEREAVMERIYLKVWDEAAGYDAAHGSPGAWLISLAHELAVGHARREPVGAARRARDVIELHGDNASLETLPAIQRKCVELTYYRGMTVGQASEHLGMTSDATSGALSEAMGTLAPAGELRSVG